MKKNGLAGEGFGRCLGRWGTTAFATLLFSMDTSSVNGWRGKSSSFRMPPFKSTQKPRVAF